MLVSKICLTGGPCAGKTSALSLIEQELSDMGYKVFIIDEVATRLINAGIKPFGLDAISMMNFEEIMLKHQLIEEEAFEKTANLINKKCVIICDRGIFDIKSFISDNEFDALLKKYNLSKISLMDNYGMVVHMNTAAKGAEKFYTTENNKARSEGIKDARLRDDKCQQAWSFHNNLKIIDNSTDFNDKLKKVIDSIKNHLGIETRNEKKYLIEINDNVLDILKTMGCVKVKIKQTYLKTNGNYEMRLRKRTIDDDSTYYVTIKKNYKGNKKVVTEEKINRKTYERLLQQREIVNVVEKERLCFVYNDKIYKLDVFKDKTCLLESASDAMVPNFINVIKEVTQDDNYYNINIKNDGISFIKKDKRFI